jgi:hypothetical protein
MTLIQCYFNFRADLYEEFTFKSMERAEGKEGDLFKVIKYIKSEKITLY